MLIKVTNHHAAQPIERNAILRLRLLITQHNIQYPFSLPSLLCLQIIPPLTNYLSYSTNYLKVMLLPEVPTLLLVLRDQHYQYQEEGHFKVQHYFLLSDVTLLRTIYELVNVECFMFIHERSMYLLLSEYSFFTFVY